MNKKKNSFNVQMTERETELMSLGKPIVCPACRETSYLYPKGVGYQPYIWEMNCNLCHLHNLGLDAYVTEHEELYEKLVQLRNRYIAGETSKELENEINNLSEEFDNKLNNRICECGGHLSISAKPKCIFCDLDIFDSYFHFTDDAPHRT